MVMLVFAIEKSLVADILLMFHSRLNLIKLKSNYNMVTKFEKKNGKKPIFIFQIMRNFK